MPRTRSVNGKGNPTTRKVQFGKPDRHIKKKRSNLRTVGSVSKSIQRFPPRKLPSIGRNKPKA